MWSQGEPEHRQALQTKGGIHCFFVAPFHAQKASKLLGAMSFPQPHLHSEVKAGGEMYGEDRRHPWEAQCTSRSRAAPSWTPLASRPRTTLAAVPAWRLAATFFLALSPTVSPCSWSILLGILPLTGQIGCHCPQIGSLHKMQVPSSILVRISETRYKPGMLEMSMNQERRKYSSLKKA